MRSNPVQLDEICHQPEHHLSRLEFFRPSMPNEEPRCCQLQRVTQTQDKDSRQRLFVINQHVVRKQHEHLRKRDPLAFRSPTHQIGLVIDSCIHLSSLPDRLEVDLFELPAQLAQADPARCVVLFRLVLAGR